MSSLHAWAQEHHKALQGLLAAHEKDIETLARDIASIFRSNRTLLFCGNGGSACDAMHIAGEFVGRFQIERKGLPAMALTADSGILTAVGNDYGYDRIFARQVEAIGREGDMLIALSTSGKSPNVLYALEAARAKKLRTVLMTGEKGKTQSGAADRLIVVPSTNTAHVQEAHMFALHAIASMVDEALGAA